MSALILREPFHEIAQQIAVDLPGATAIFTTRRGGRSLAPYDSLNLGVLTDDEEDSVVANHKWLEQTFGVRLAYGRQVHGVDVRTVTAATDPVAELFAADAIATVAVGVAPTIVAADCLPIVIAGGGAVIAIHAGWNGLLAGILGKGVAAMRKLAASTTPESRFHAAIGPGAGRCCYEVSDELHRRFAAAGYDERHGENLDLKAIAAHQLQAAGVETVHDVAICTICSPPELLFSHRRDAGITGRQGVLAWLT